MATRAELEAALTAARTERDRGDAEDSQAEAEREKARARWVSYRTDWERVDAEYSRIRTEDARALEERLRGRTEREAAYNAAADAFEQLLTAETGKRRELEDAYAK